MTGSLTFWKLPKKSLQRMKQQRKNASPNLAVLLRDYLNLRKAERSEWSRYGQQKGTTDDLKTKKISQATVYLQRHELFTLEDLDIALQGVSEKLLPFVKICRQPLTA